jgi:SAM-dependent methyltransferase
VPQTSQGIIVVTVDVSNEKYAGELAFWKERKQIEGKLNNGHFKPLMLQISGRPESFFAGKVLADFGCGPRGSLEWAKQAKHRYGIDVLADEYWTLGADEHEAEYITSTEDRIPLPDGIVDVMFSINAIDHAVNWPHMMRECIRVMKPGGLIAFSVNLDEAWSPTEPNTVREDEVRDVVSPLIAVDRWQTANRSTGPDKYLHLRAWADTGATPPPYNGKWGMLWFSGLKR